jgi:hypothetical protein
MGCIVHLKDGGEVISSLGMVRVTVPQKTAKGLPKQSSDEEMDSPLRHPLVWNLDHLQSCVCHGNVHKSLQVVPSR